MPSFHHDRPIYKQISEIIYGRICRGHLPAGEKLPSVRELAVELGVNPNTVSRTYIELEREGIVLSRRGQGTFVTENEHVIDDLRTAIAKEKTAAFLTLMNDIGFTAEDTVSLIQREIKEGGEC
ncbi:GntR family transcriptional regulator [Salisediminibacterium halotolerans]|uniref:GntR family transcriptional regulator n=1 Tax=Salisediminibacterium halotolerans TaxID=517425 RepID=UPI000EAB524C|nr:GntR family transcriptional regulator [Salisediminibacterium halotolerans]RLJ74096.1 GntR family transcriptional regulator [Actinophytocola xinjiangensis]RPE87811.1 GntR family transcriptional regulator [Salisediminibacterium halotolerans]TWG34933.1 GntR family transcriptional regulator [Salisediminibacterium halotolerans]GEL08234.1 putative HTH-type transcriptional regulator YhcF [Salisediminibacterium halotolerans]